MKLSTTLVVALSFFSKIFEVDYDTSHVGIDGVLIFLVKSLII